MGTTVDFTTSFGDIVIQLFDADAPQTVADFLSYANNMTPGSGYTNTLFSRLASGFVLQGGGYDYNMAQNRVDPIPTNAPVANEYTGLHSNTLGTVALAKVSGNPNSATDQFFINLGDNSSNLDTQNGGFVVFGQVTATSFPVVQQIANLPAYDESSQLGSPFTSIPLQNFTAGNGVTRANLVVVTAVTVTPCYCPGTLIGTPDGERPIEALAIGDLVLTASGAARPIRWIGRRAYAAPFAASNPAIQPVLIRAGALGGGLPRRDLHVSSNHAMFLDGVLVHARHLVNGATIVQQRGRAEVSYIHLELDSHDIILAEGAPAETFRDDDSRAIFHNADQYVKAAYPAAPAPACAPLVADGPVLEALHARLDRDAVQTVWICATGVHTIAIQPGVSAVRLRTPSGHVAGDARRLGLAVAAVKRDGMELLRDDTHLVSGWHGTEAGWRWTDGMGVVMVAGSSMLVIDVAATYQAKVLAA